MPLLAPSEPDSTYIRRMFDSFAARYDIFSWLIGMGQAGRLRRHALNRVRPGIRVLDLAAGTGDLAIEAARRMNGSGEVTALDFSGRMLAFAQKKFARRMAGKQTPRFLTVCSPAEELPLGKMPYDLIVSGYALRNFYRNIRPILQGVRASLAPGGRIAFLDLTEPPGKVRGFLFRAYLYCFVGIYGTALFGKNYPVSYLPDSAGRFFKAKEFEAVLREEGFEDVRTRSFMLGAVTLYKAKRPG